MNAIAPLPLPGNPISFAVPAKDGGGEIRLGMPHLSGTGLSENWLLKELGHRHWTRLAWAAGKETPNFRDGEGRPVYAAFCAVRLEDARFDLGRENGHLAIRSGLRRVSRTQVESRHELAIDGLAAGTVDMVSTFVRRTERSNHSVARVALDGLMPVDPAASPLANLAASLRAKRLPRHFGFDLDRPSASGEWHFAFDPCPQQDFNGAGFLYFPSFLGFVDRAEWLIDRRPAILARRETFYYGNVDVGVPIRVVLLAERPALGTRWWRLERPDGQVALADVFVQRR